MQDVVLVEGRCPQYRAKNLNRKLERFTAHAVVIATGGYKNAYFLSTNAMTCNRQLFPATARGAWMANPALYRFTRHVPRSWRQAV